MTPNLVEQLRALDELHRAGSLSDAEFEAAKAQLLGQNAPANTAQLSSSHAAPDLLLLQNELARIDREWELERPKYRVAGRYRSSIPSPGSGTSSGIAITIFGGVWTAFAFFMALNASSSSAPSMGMPFSLFVWIFPLFGVFVVIAGLSKGAEMNQKADSHQLAEREYQNRRAKVLAKMRAFETP